MTKKKKNFSLVFRGVRGSYPVSNADVLKYGGHTSCVEVHVDNHLIYLDAGTGIIQSGIQTTHDTMKPLTITILFSHMHYDHTQGLPFFRALFQPTTTAFFFGPKALTHTFEGGLKRAMVSPHFPVELDDLQSIRILRGLKPNEVIVFQKDSEYPEVYLYPRELDLFKDAPVKIWIEHSYAHPDGGVYFYRIEYKEKSVVYATDTEGYYGGDLRLIQFAKDADILIHDSQYLPETYLDTAYVVQGFGHSTCEMAAENAKKAGVKKLYLFHFDPSYTDAQVDQMVERARKIFPRTYAAQEGLEVRLI